MCSLLRRGLPTVRSDHARSHTTVIVREGSQCTEASTRRVGGFASSSGASEPAFGTERPSRDSVDGGDDGQARPEAQARSLRRCRSGPQSGWQRVLVLDGSDFQPPRHPGGEGRVSYPRGSHHRLSRHGRIRLDLDVEPQTVRASEPRRRAALAPRLGRTASESPSRQACGTRRYVSERRRATRANTPGPASFRRVRPRSTATATTTTSAKGHINPFGHPRLCPSAHRGGP